MCSVTEKQLEIIKAHGDQAGGDICRFLEHYGLAGLRDATAGQAGEWIFREYGGSLFTFGELEELRRADEKIEAEFEATYSPSENRELDRFLDELALRQLLTEEEYAGRIAAREAKKLYYRRNREKFRRYYISRTGRESMVKNAEIR